MATDDQDDTNEILAETRSAKERREAAAASGDSAKAKRWPIATIGLGIGSAAVAAALLYANRSRQKR